MQSLRQAACLHVSKETAVLLDSLHSIGLEISLVAAIALSSQSDLVDFLKNRGIDGHAKRGEDLDQYEGEIRHAAESRPELIMDDGGDLHVAYARTNFHSCFGGTDETTSGTIRLRALDRNGRLRYPSIPVNEANTKHLFDNRYGTGQSTLDGLLRATGLLIASKTIVIAGYGFVGKGVAERVRGLGGRVIVTEVEPIKALEAKLDGFDVMPMNDAAHLGDIFLTCTGQIQVIGSAHFPLMKDRALIGNVGHFNEEIDTKALYRMGERVEQVRENVTEIYLKKGGIPKKLHLLNQGRVVNLVSAEGHPPEIMQLSFANQLLSIYYLVIHRQELRKSKNMLLDFPKEIDDLVGKFALSGFGLKIDSLSRKQKQYSVSFRRGSA